MFHSLRIFSHLQDKNHTETTLTTRREGVETLAAGAIVLLRPALLLYFPDMVQPPPLTPAVLSW